MVRWFADKLFSRLAAWACLVTVLWAIQWGSPTAQAESNSVASFYRGKTVTVAVGYSAGGGFDLYARLLARHLGKYIPGNPTVIVQNMPGAGSLVAANYLYNVAPRDGTVIGTFHPFNLLLQLTGQSGARFDATHFNWIGNMTEDGYVLYVRSDVPVRRFEDLLTVPVKIGVTGPGSPRHLLPNLMNGVLRTKFTIITGYPGSNEVDLALERGELEAATNIWSSVKSGRSDWLVGNPPFIRLLVQVGRSRHPDLKDVPLITEFAREERQRRVFASVSLPFAMVRPFVAPPGVPGERVQALRNAFMRALQDPQLRQEAKAASMSLDNPSDGETVEQLAQELLRRPREETDLIARFLK